MAKTRIIPSSPAMILEDDKRYMIVADLHLGFEGAFESREIFVGKNTAINETVSELKKMIKAERPDVLVLLGDTKSGIEKISKSEWDSVPLFFSEMNKIVQTVLIPGNHDANIQRLVPDETSMTGPAGLVLDDVLFTHGHAMPPGSFSHVNRIVMGHVHPVFFQEGSVLNGQKVWVSIRADRCEIFPSQAGGIEITVMPSFNRYIHTTRKYGYKKSISPIIKRIKNPHSARIVTLDGAIIGDEKSIGTVL